MAGGYDGATDPLVAALMRQQAQNQLVAQQRASLQRAQGQPNTALGTAANALAEALLARRQGQAATALAQALYAQQQARAQGLFPGDAQAEQAYLADPDAMTKAFAERYGPQTLRPGNTLVNTPAPVAGAQGGAGGIFTAPGSDTAPTASSGALGQGAPAALQALPPAPRPPTFFQPPPGYALDGSAP